LGAKLDAVSTRGHRKPVRRTFSDLIDESEAVALPAKPRKKSTLVDYGCTIRLHLRPALGHLDLERLSRSPEEFERYAGDKIGAGLSPKSVRNHLVLAGLMFKTARRWRWVSENPLELVEPPAMPDHETETLTAAEIAAVLKAYLVLEQAADDDEKPWYAAARRMTTVALSTGLRRGELLGLRWQDVELLDKLIHVRQQFVRNEITTPKSRAGRMTLPLGDVAAKALEEQYATSRHRAPESIVFSHPALGTPLDPSKLTGYSRKAIKRGRDHEAVSTVARSAAYGADGDGRGRRAGDVRAGEGGPRAGLDDRALLARGEDVVP
jgi:integrase